NTQPASTALAHDEVADAIAFDPAGWLRSYVKTPDPRAFGQLAQRLEPALRTLAARGDAKTLWMVSSTLHGVSMEGTQAVGSRAQTAMRVLRVFDGASGEVNCCLLRSCVGRSAVNGTCPV